MRIMNLLLELQCIHIIIVFFINYNITNIIMCRWMCYYGNPIELYTLLYTPPNSLLKQCYQTPHTPGIDNNPRDNPINVDGVGIGLYQSKKIPFIYTSTNTPWTDINLERITKYMKSRLFFAHIRGIKPFNGNSFVHELNCHPFTYKNYIMQHNGFISNHKQIKVDLHNMLNKNALSVIKGNVDSEDIFALFINQIKSNELDSYISIEQIYTYLIQTIKIIINLNNNDHEEPPSLYIKNTNNNIIIASEPFDYNDDWILIPKNNAILIDKYKNYSLKKIIIS